MIWYKKLEFERNDVITWTKNNSDDFYMLSDMDIKICLALDHHLLNITQIINTLEYLLILKKIMLN